MTGPQASADVLMFFVNGKKITVKNADPETTLLTYLRNSLHLTGSKLGCGEGGCGACTVMVSKWEKNSETVKHYSVNACLAPVVSVHECAVTTIEGIGSSKTKLHQVQERLVQFHGSQCGFCTPGIVMSMYALLRNKKIPTSSDVDECLQGNLCRCTGYRPILAAFQTFTCDMGDECCRNKQNNCLNKDELNSDKKHYSSYDPSQELIFPPELSVISKSTEMQKSLTFVGERVTWNRPVTLNEMTALKAKFPDARIVVGNTKVGIEMNVKGRCYSHSICTSNIPEMKELRIEEDGVCIGASCTLTEVSEFLIDVTKQRHRDETQVFDAILRMLKLLAGTQIRNVACIGGNIMTASPISDLNPIFIAGGVKLTFISGSSGKHNVLMDDHFFTGYKRTNTKPDDVLLFIRIPFTTKDDVFFAYKQSKRREADTAIVNAAFKVSFNPESSKVQKLSSVFGGMDAVTKIPKQTAQKMVGRKWDSDLLQDVCKGFDEEMTLQVDAPGGMVQYRRTLVTSFFFKFYHYVLSVLMSNGKIAENFNSVEVFDDISAEKEKVHGTQTWQEVPKEQNVEDTIGRPVQHLSAEKQVTGEAQYVDDMPAIEGELHMALVCSTHTHAKIKKVDISDAMAANGFVSYISRNDVMGDNEISGEQVFADGKVTCIGHVIGAVIADTQSHALIASRMIKVEYEDLEPQIITIEDAIKHQSFFGSMKIKKGSVEDCFQDCDHILEEEMRVGGQEHFYMETQSCIAIPRDEDEEMEIWCSCQCPEKLQDITSKCLGVAKNKVIVRVKRLGGGFGGKLERFCLITNPAVVAARKLGKPIRCMLTRQNDMLITGGRHPFLGRYKVGFNKNGRILALYEKLYANGGNTPDLTIPVVEEALVHCENCYNIPNMEIHGFACRTNIASNTGFRGFGIPQAMIIAEDWISRIASFLSISPEKVRDVNMYKDGDVTHFGLKVKDFLARRCWKESLEKSDFHAVRKEIDKFNAKNKWKKRGIACVPSKFRIALGSRRLNQAGALVLVYTDGSVLLHHGGVEMGQGLHTKMIQVASRVLEVPLSFIHISETSTASVPNTSATAASISSDLNGMAVKQACETIKQRLEPIKKANPNSNWPELVEKAYVERISLSATGFYKVPGMNSKWDRKTGIMTGNMYNYLAYGAAVSQVEIDVLTGHHVVMRTDLVVDVGNSLNPAIDIGQIEGGFVQGYGMMTLEEPLHSSSGQLWTVGPGSYKIPGFSNTPKKFNVYLLRSCPNEKAIYSSKGVGEPSLFLASSVLFALKDSIASARRDNGLSGPFRLDSPATAERIRMSCGDELTIHTKSNQEAEEGKTPWSIRT